MTIEDFAESVIAGWVPVAWHSAVHVVVVACKWVALQVALALAVRLPRR
jgi:hypothetical protein